MNKLKTDHLPTSIARNAALNTIQKETAPKPLTKFAFDTRRINQETERNPRSNLQYWHRSEEFLTKEDELKLGIFSKLGNVLGVLRKTLGKEPEWFNSYSRQLYDNVNRVLRVKEADMDIFRPQLSYLEQLIYARYRLTLENLEKLSEEELSRVIISKDEALVGRHDYLKKTSDEELSVARPIVKNNSLDKNTQESIINAIFGSSGANIRKDGERSVERVITIKIVDSVID